jgi:transcriptional regulator with XRE-family HTH domain
MGRKKGKKKIRDMTPAELSSASDGIVIAWNFIRIRERLGLTQERAAESGGVTVGYIGKVETAAVSFGTRAQQKWARIFDVERTEFLKRPDIGIRVLGDVMEKGAVRLYEKGHEVEYVPLPPGYTREASAAPPALYCLKVATDALYPHLRRGSYLYVKRLPISVVRNDNLVVYAEEGEPAGIKEVELLPGGRVLLKGLGRGNTITKEAGNKEAGNLTAIDKIVFIGI